MSNPTCVIVYRHPARVALRLGHHWYKGAFAKMSAGAAWVAARVCMDTAHFNTHTHTPLCSLPFVSVSLKALDGQRAAGLHTLSFTHNAHKKQTTHHHPHTEAWLSVWEHLMVSALQACRGRPTVLVQVRFRNCNCMCVCVPT